MSQELPEMFQRWAAQIETIELCYPSGKSNEDEASQTQLRRALLNEVAAYINSQSGNLLDLRIPMNLARDIGNVALVECAHAASGRYKEEENLIRGFSNLSVGEDKF